MPLEQKARQKLKRRQRSRKPGDAASATHGGLRGQCELLRRWADPSRGDLRRLATAVRRGQLDEADDDFRASIVEIVGRVIDSPQSTRHVLAAAWVFIRCEWKNIEAEECELRAANLSHQLT